MTVLNFAVRALAPARRRSDPRRQGGSPGEHLLQERLGTTDRARQFYRMQVVDQLTPIMREFIARMDMAFIATSDAAGQCDCSFRAGEPGFIQVVDDRTIAYPEYRGNGVMATMGNMLLNPHAGIFMADFTRDLIGLHINGDTEILTPGQMRELGIELPEPENRGRQPVMWVLITITEAYIHCTKRIPRLVPEPRVGHWVSGGPRHKGGNYFGVVPAEESA